MGQRHQIFLISKIQNRYRTLAAVHHQWLYGAGTTKACWRILKILEHPANQKLVKHELRYAAVRPDEWWDGLERNRCATHFPVVLTCLILGAMLDPRPEFYHQSSNRAIPFSITTDFDGVENDDGVTVIDISNLDAIRYCFFFLHTLTPLTGIEYYRTYYEDSPSAPQPADLGAWDLIHDETLRGLWPHGDWKKAEVLNTTRGSSVEGCNGPIKSLRDLAFQRAIQSMADEPEQVKHLVAVEHIPRFHNDLWEFLHQNPDLVRRRGGLQLLGLAMRQTNILDISCYPWVTETQILELVEENSLAEHIFSIDLSNSTMVDTGSIRKILNACPNVTELSVLCVDNLPLLPLLDSLDGSKVTKVLHSDLFRYPISRANAAAISGRFSSATKTRHVVRQAIAIRDNTGNCRNGPGSLGLRWRDLLGDGDGGEASVLPLFDAMLNPVDVHEWLRQLLCVIGGPQNPWFEEEEFAMICAEHLSVSITDLWKITPLPGKIYQPRVFPVVAASSGASRRKSPCHDEIRLGEWTVLVLAGAERRGHEGRLIWPTVKYAFLTRNHQGHLVIADMKEFYRLATQQEGCPDAKLAEFEKQTGDLGGDLYAIWSSRYGDRLLAKEPDDVLKFCGEDEVMEIMSEVLLL
ncbi:hypothetical protein B0T25DRAFT_134962 [Lasiosphaeria hispida]|uniref:Uncharacterized protein n=1 Tax=Lasiosphaeria hispida TaxID=260671 RepID=A0AAJ0HKN2_9PEZI|nr:hypothetical protein B0T25DRAFT_134962 [Lasiosphaeria hispida]